MWHMCAKPKLCPSQTLFNRPCVIAVPVDYNASRKTDKKPKLYILTNAMNGIGWDHELLWQFATSRGLDRRAFLGLLVSSGAAGCSPRVVLTRRARTPTPEIRTLMLPHRQPALGSRTRNHSSLATTKPSKPGMERPLWTNLVRRRSIRAPTLYPWARFAFVWDAVEGDHALTAHAHDDAGNTQPDAVPLNGKGYLFNQLLPHPIHVE